MDLAAQENQIDLQMAALKLRAAELFEILKKKIQKELEEAQDIFTKEIEGAKIVSGFLDRIKGSQLDNEADFLDETQKLIRKLKPNSSERLMMIEERLKEIKKTMSETGEMIKGISRGDWEGNWIPRKGLSQFRASFRLQWGNSSKK